jgi:signal transduction histidine kinase
MTNSKKGVINKEERKNRFALTALFTACIFVVLLITTVISFTVVSMFLKRERIPVMIDGHSTAKYAILFMVWISLIVGTVVAVIMSQLILKYVNRLINHMNRLAAGDFKARLSYGKPLGYHPTCREITDSFNRMADELEHTEMLRGDFVNNFSHEFKTPIVSIAGFTKLLKKGNLTEEEKGEYLDIIEEEALRLASMATNVLDMTKVENQAILTDTSCYNLSEQIRSCVLMLEKRWTKKNIEFSLEFDEEEICANEELLRQVWVNLIDNAVKYSPEYGFVKISIREDADQWYRVQIANSGIEIPKEKQKKIFEKFYQADESHSSEGNGIGLAIVKTITELHGGTVSVECANGITTFTVKIPRNRGKIKKS